MGNKNSTGSMTDLHDDSTSSFRRTASLPTNLKKPKFKYLADFHYAASYIVLQTENFQGVRYDSQYREIESQIVDLSKELQKFRSKLIIDSDKSAADGIQKTISDCLASLLRKAQEAESAGLDNAAVESTSFIAQTFEKPIKKQTKSQPAQESKNQNTAKAKRAPQKALPKQHRGTHTLHQIEIRVAELKANVTNAVFCQQTEVFKKHEDRIKALCRDLELIDADDHTPLEEKKNELYNTLIKCNNHIKKARRKLQRQVAVDIPDQVVQKSELELLEEDITNAKALAMQGDKSLEDIKIRFQELLKRAIALHESNALQGSAHVINNIRSNLENIHFKEVQQRLNHLQIQVHDFTDVSSSTSYTVLDQQLRQLWNRLTALDVQEERKGVIVGEIQATIQLLAQKARENEDKKQSTLYQNKEVIAGLSTYTATITQQKVDKPPLPTPREEAVPVKSFEKSIDDLIEAWHIAKRQAVWRNFKQMELARIKIKLSNLGSNIEETLNELDTESEKFLEKPESNVVSLRVENSQDALADRLFNQYDSKGSIKKAENTIEIDADAQNPVPNSYAQEVATPKPVMYVKPETNKVATKPVQEIEPTQSTAKSDVKVLGHVLDSNTIYFDFTNKKNQQPITSSQLEDEFARVQSKMLELRNQIDTFSGNTKNSAYDKIKNNLDNCLKEVNAVDTGAYHNLEIAKISIIKETLNLIDDLDYKILENQGKRIKTREHLKRIAEKLHTFKRKVDQFNGSYKNVMYVQIEDELKHSLDELQGLTPNGDSKLTFAISQAQQKAEHYLKILEDKSAKIYETPVVVQPDNTRASASLTETINILRLRLTGIKDDAQKFNGTFNDPVYHSIKENLLACTEELHQIDDQGRSSIKESKQQYLDYIKELQKYLDQKANQAMYYQDDADNSQQPQEDYVIMPIVTEKHNPYIKMQQIERSFENISKKVDTFVGNQSDKLYAYLDEMLILTLIALDNLTLIKDEGLSQRRSKLLKDVHAYTKILSEKAKRPKFQQHDTLEDIWLASNYIKLEIDTRLDVDDDTYEDFNERLVHLLLKAEEIECDDDGKRQRCKEHISEILRILQSRASYTTEESDQGQIKFIADINGIKI